jgi:transcriptional regulator with XRE-family HTH domain
MNAEPTDEARTLLRTIGRRVRLARLTRELTQAELAAAAGMSRSFLSLIEHGSHGVDIVRLHRLGVALELPLVDLIDDRNANDR